MTWEGILLAIGIAIISIHQVILSRRVDMVVKWLNRQEHRYIPLDPNDVAAFTAKKKDDK